MVKHPYNETAMEGPIRRDPQLVDPSQLSRCTYALPSKLTSQPLIPLNGSRIAMTPSTLMVGQGETAGGWWPATVVGVEADEGGRVPLRRQLSLCTDAFSNTTFLS